MKRSSKKQLFRTKKLFSVRKRNRGDKPTFISSITDSVFLCNKKRKTFEINQPEVRYFLERRDSMAHILVVDDEPLLVKGIKFNLESEGHDVVGCHDGQAGLEQAQTQKFDLIILDLMMPKMDGLECCMAIRGFSNVPIVMLTAKGEDTDKIIGFEYGADDYITKPFNILELKARVRALLRRSMRSNKEQEEEVTLLTLGHISLDTVSRSATRLEEAVELTAKEFNLMELLMQNPERVYSRENLLNLVWGFDYVGDDRTVDVHIRRLREKLELDPASPAFLKTKWGVGYYLSKPES